MKVIPGEGGKKSLLEKAMAVPVIRRTPAGGPAHEELELAVAWYCHQVTSKQVAAAASIPESAVSSKMQTWLRNGIQTRRVKLEMAKDDDE